MSVYTTVHPHLSNLHIHKSIDHEELSCKLLKLARREALKSVKQLSTKCGQCGMKVNQLAEDISMNKQQKGEITATLHALEQKFKELRDTQADLLQRESSCNGELSSLERLEREREGLGAGVRAILEEKETSGNFTGIIGTLSDLITVKPGYEYRFPTAEEWEIFKNGEVE